MVKLAEAQVCLAVQLYEILNEIKIYDIGRDCILWTYTNSNDVNEYRSFVIANDIEANIKNIYE
jgi:hypothetical protein